jgi:hypothetical protein
MEFFEEMDPIEREIMILEAVQGSVAVEGMEKAAQECQTEILRLREKQDELENPLPDNRGSSDG